MCASLLTTVAPILAVLAFVHPGLAQSSPAPVASPTRFHADLEVDPTAYVLNGYSVHAGFGWNRVRIDLGAFAMHMPEAIHGQRGFNVRFHGFGVKLQIFPFAEQSGLFVGVDSGTAEALIQRKNTPLARRDRQVTFGVNLGYRIEIDRGFYATPWIGLSHAFGAEDVSLDERTYERIPWILFPAVHLGYHIL